MDRFDYYNNFTVGVLRGIARNIGVVAPTTKIKKQIIDEILNIENGLQKPKSTKYGRKPKSNQVRTLDNRLEPLVKNEVEYSNSSLNILVQSLKLNVIKVLDDLNGIIKTLDNFE